MFKFLLVFPPRLPGAPCVECIDSMAIVCFRIRAVVLRCAVSRFFCFVESALVHTSDNVRIFIEDDVEWF